MVSYELSGNPVKLERGHSGLYMFRQFGERPAYQPVCPPHQLNLIFSLQINLHLQTFINRLLHRFHEYGRS